MVKTSLTKKLKPQSVKHVLSLIVRIVNFGVKKHLCNPLTFTVEYPKVDNKKTEDLTTEQLDALFYAIDTDENKEAASFMKLVLYTGLRRSELFKLKWKHVDFRKGFIFIVDPKGGQSQTIPMNDSARKILSLLEKAESPYVFPGKDGKQRVTIARPINRIKKRAGLPDDFRPLHGLRHVYASMLASSGKVDMYTLQKLLTHKSPAMTQRYAHLRDETLKCASNLMEELVNQAINTDKESKEFDNNSPSAKQEPKS